MTVLTQETDQSYSPFQTAVRTNLQLIIDERIATDKPMTLSMWIVCLVVFGGEDPETGLIVGLAFLKGFFKGNNIKVREIVGSFHREQPRHQQALVHLIIKHNVITCLQRATQGDTRLLDPHLAINQFCPRCRQFWSQIHW
jgi:hypothetical protein